MTNPQQTDTIYRGGGTGVRHQTVTRQEWLRAGAGNETIKTEATQRRHRRHGTQETQNRVLQGENLHLC